VRSTWSLSIIGLVVFTLISTACTPAERPDDVNNRQNNALYQEDGNGNYYGNRFISSRNGTIDNDAPGPRNDPTRAVRNQNEIGFVRYNPADGGNDDGRGTQRPEFYVDRDALAHQIGSLVTAFPDINDALVLVTDDHVFIGVDDGEGKALEAKTVDKVRRSALSVVPRYYKVHVTDDEDMRQRMTQIGDRLTNNGNAADYRDQISDMLREMGDDTPPRPNANNRNGNGIDNGISEFDDAGTGGRMRTGGNNR
jgi:hypothetical protein